jgi:hypothetical protein
VSAPELVDDLVKAHVKGHVRLDGTYVRPYERGGLAAPEPHHHPRLGDNGKPVLVEVPHHASSHSTWYEPDAVATFLPDGDVPLSLNHVALRSWKEHPKTSAGWNYEEGILHDLREPPLKVPFGKKAGAGV